MHEQPGDRDCGRDAIGGNHFGPVMVYLSAVADATTADGSDPFFKIGEFGYDPASDTWGTDVLNQNCGQFEVTLPANLAEGDYLVRAEAVALHTAGQPGGAQFYMSCFVSWALSFSFSFYFASASTLLPVFFANWHAQQLHVTGGSGATPSGVSFPGAYSANDPGILINIWTDDLSNYQIPGPAVVA